MVEVIFCVGIAASGKTTWARGQEKNGYYVLDSDAVREELYGDATCQDNPEKVFNLIYSRGKEILRAGGSIILCSTNLTMKYRVHAIKIFKQVRPDAIIRAVVFNTPLEVCREQNQMRNRQVPDWLFMKQIKTLQLPVYEEGFDRIQVVNNYGNLKVEEIKREIADKVLDYGSQKNKHHSLTLYEHNMKCWFTAESKHLDEDICLACYLHDYGKAYTATYWPEKDDDCHYPNHAAVGAYLALNAGFDYHVALLVNYHMFPYTDSHTQEIWSKKLGTNLWNELLLVHECDEAAH